MFLLTGSHIGSLADSVTSAPVETLLIMARSAAVACAKMPSYSRGPDNIRVRVRVIFATRAVRLAILATAGLLVT